MTHGEKVSLFSVEMRKRGVGAYTSAPPFYRLLWALGAAVPPPHFQSFTSLATTMGSVWAVIFGAVMYFMQWRTGGMSIARVCGLALMSGVIFGLIMAGYYRSSARRWNLPRWEDYPGV